MDRREKTLLIVAKVLAVVFNFAPNIYRILLLRPTNTYVTINTR